MADSQWGRNWYQSPTEITRNGKTYYFIGNIENSCGTFTMRGVSQLKQAARENGISVRVTHRSHHDCAEIWADDKRLGDLVDAETIPYEG